MRIRSVHSFCLPAERRVDIRSHGTSSPGWHRKREGRSGPRLSKPTVLENRAGRHPPTRRRDPLASMRRRIALRLSGEDRENSRASPSPHPCGVGGVAARCPEGLNSQARSRRATPADGPGRLTTPGSRRAFAPKTLGSRAAVQRSASWIIRRGPSSRALRAPRRQPIFIPRQQTRANPPKLWLRRPIPKRLGDHGSHRQPAPPRHRASSRVQRLIRQ
jgi:hypothetical protein